MWFVRGKTMFYYELKFSALFNDKSFYKSKVIVVYSPPPFNLHFVILNWYSQLLQQNVASQKKSKCIVGSTNFFCIIP